MFAAFPNVSFEVYDAIIIGSGPAGATVARQLATHGKRSLLIETGALEFDNDLHEAYSQVYATGHYGSEYWPLHCIRTFGGASSVWAGWCAPLTERNLAQWPISIGELDHYYPQAARILGRTTDFLTYEAPFLTGFKVRPFSWEDPLRVNEAYEADFRDSTQIDVLLETNVTELFANEARNRVTGFRAFNAATGHRDINLGARQQIVLAAGGLGNPHILLASRSGGTVAIGNETDQVGRYLLEHPHLYRCARMVVAPDMTFEALPAGFGDRHMTLVPEDDVYRRYGELDASLEMVETPLDSEDNVEQHVVRMLGGEAIAYDVTVRSEMPPDPENRVELAEGADPSGMPRIRVRCMVAGDALRIVDNYLRHIGGVLMQEGRGRIRINNMIIYRSVTGVGHPMGSTRMGDDPRTSVVDRNCRVHGYSNLHVAGSSVFTTGGYANPTLTIVAMALRLADHLGETT